MLCKSKCVIFLKITKIANFSQEKKKKKYEDFAVAPEPCIFSMQKTSELKNIPGTVPQFSSKT